MAGAQRHGDRPADRLTRIGGRMNDALEADPEYRPGDKAIVMLGNDDEGKGGIALFGYDDDTKAMADLILHLKAIFEANGKEFRLVPLGRPDLS